MKTSCRKSAGLLMYRISEDGIEVLLAHPGGPYYTNKDNGYWTIPKGEPDADEDLFQTAIREFTEETGISPKGRFIPLGSVTQKGGKEVYCWAVEGNLPDNYNHKSNLIEIQWPKGSGRKIKIPEIDKIEFFRLRQAKNKIKETQIPLIERLEKILT
jgi:predicted NUDIX family NTP pyrophosphohydrolase